MFTQVFDQPDEMETGGLYFPMAIGNLCTIGLLTFSDETNISYTVVGLYIEHICLICLLVLKANAADGKYRTAAIIQASFMVVLIILTAFAHMFIHNSYTREYHLSYQFQASQSVQFSNENLLAHVPRDEEDGAALCQAETHKRRRG